MKMKILLPTLLILLLSACAFTQKQPAQILQEGDAPNAESNEFTLDTTVGEVISDPAFGDFGRLLFPVDRAVPEDMTLNEVSTSNVYVWYSDIQPDKTVEILNTLREKANDGSQVFLPLLF